MTHNPRKPAPLPRTVTTPDGAWRLTGPRHMILPPLPGEVEAALERMKATNHINWPLLQRYGAQSRVELLYLAQAPAGMGRGTFFKRNRVHEEYIPRAGCVIHHGTTTGRIPRTPNLQDPNHERLAELPYTPERGS